MAFLFSSSSAPTLVSLHAEIKGLRAELQEQKNLLQQLQTQVQQSQGQPKPVSTAESVKSMSVAPHPAWRLNTSLALRPLPSLPSTPGHGHWTDRQDDAFENMSLYSQATTTASQPAVYQERGKARKLGPFQGWGNFQGDSQGLGPEQFLSGCDGVLGTASLVQVQEAVGQDMAPWVHALTTPGTGAEDISDITDDIRRRTNDQEVTPRPSSQDLSHHTVTTILPTLTTGKDVASNDTQAPGKAGPRLLACVALLSVCQSDEAARERVLRAGGLPHVVQLLASSAGDVSQKRVAAHLLWYLSRSPLAGAAMSNHSWVAAGMDGIKEDPGLYVGRVLVEVMAGGQRQQDVYTTHACARALNNLTMQNDSVRVGAAAGGAVGVLLSLLTSEDNVGAEAAASALLGLTAGEEGSVNQGGSTVCQQLVETPGAIKTCLQMLRYSDPLLQDSLAGVMQNVTMNVVGDPKYTDALVEAGCIAALLEVARCGGYTTQEGAVSALGNLACQESQHNALVNAGAIEILSYFITTPLPSSTDDPAAALAAAQVQSNAIMCVRNLCTGSMKIKQALLDRGAVKACLVASQGAGGTWATAGTDDVMPSSTGADPSTQDELDEHYAELQSWALGAVLSLSTEPAVREQLVSRCQVAPPLLGVLLGGAPQAKELVAKVLTNLSIPDTCKSLLVSQGAAMVLVPLVRTGSRTGRQAACRALYNLAKLAANRTEIAACGGVAALLEAVADHEPAVFEAAAAALHGLCNHLQVIGEAVERGAARVLLSTVRARHLTITSRGTRLCLRLLQRMVLLHPSVMDDIPAEVSALGLC